MNFSAAGWRAESDISLLNLFIFNWQQRTREEEAILPLQRLYIYFLHCIAHDVRSTKSTTS